MSTIEDAFEIVIYHPSEVNQILAEAKELLLLHSLASLRDMENKPKCDGLTGVYNRAYFDETLQQEFQVAQQKHAADDSDFDIDHFNRINDTYGYVTGDALLIALADRL